MRVLIIESDARAGAALADALRASSHDVLVAADSAAAHDALESYVPDIVLCDCTLQDFDGLRFLALCGGRGLRSVVMTGPPGNDRTALDAFQRGAYDYVPRPLRIDHALLVLRKAIDQESLRQEVARLREQLGTTAAVAAVPSEHLRSAPASAAAQASGAASADEDLSVKRRTAVLERTLIRRALERTGGNRTRAARLLDLSHRALLYKIREYGLTP